jgi:MFS family permease
MTLNEAAIANGRWEGSVLARVGATTHVQSTRSVVFASMVGTVIEYFDFLVYATVAGLVFGKLFFPNQDEFIGTLLAVSTFAVGYLARPVGGIVFGHYGDRLGRRRILFITLLMMGSSTLLIGLLPTYSVIGIAAPVLLIAFRIVQGIGVGGEFGGATLMVIEHAHDSGKRGLLGSLTTASSAAGFLVASGLLAVLTSVTTADQFEAWGWRIPFLLSAMLVGVGFYLRFRISETPVMQNALEQEKVVSTPLMDVFRRYPMQVVTALGAPFGLFIAYYVVLVFSVPFASHASAAPSSFLLIMSTLGQALYLGMIVFWGWLSDRVGRRLPMLIGAGGLSVWGFAFFPLMLSGSAAGVLLAMVVALAFMGGIFGPLAAYLAELFGTGVRYSGLSFGYQVGGSVAGGLAPVAGLALVGISGSWVPVAMMISVGALVSLSAVAVSKDVSNVDLRA